VEIKGIFKGIFEFVFSAEREKKGGRKFANTGKNKYWAGIWTKKRKKRMGGRFCVARVLNRGVERRE